MQMYNKWNFNKKWRCHPTTKVDALHIAVFKIRTLLVFTVLMAKFPNRSASILLEPIVYLPYTGKGPSGYHISHRNNTLYLKFSSVPAKCSSSESFCYPMQNVFDWINLPWKFAGGSIIRSHLSFKHWLSLSNFFANARTWTDMAHKNPSFLHFVIFHFSKCNI